jgi:hypothetical protein
MLSGLLTDEHISSNHLEFHTDTVAALLLYGTGTGTGTGMVVVLTLVSSFLTADK